MFFALHSAAGDVFNRLCDKVFVVAECHRIIGLVDFHPLQLAHFLLLGTKRGLIQGEPDEINDLLFNVRLRRLPYAPWERTNVRRSDASAKEAEFLRRAHDISGRHRIFHVSFFCTPIWQSFYQLYNITFAAAVQVLIA